MCCTARKVVVQYRPNLKRHLAFDSLAKPLTSAIVWPLANHLLGWLWCSLANVAPSSDQLQS